MKRRCFCFASDHFGPLARVLLCVVALAGAGSPSIAMDLTQAFEAALTQDATMRAARAQADASREALPQAKAQLRPEVALSVSRIRNDMTRTQPGLLGTTTTDETYFSYNQTLQLRQPLYRRPLFAGLEQARHVVDEAQATLAQAMQDLGVRVVSAYFDVLLAEDQLALVGQQRVALEAQLDSATKALASGTGIRTDIDEARARLDQNRADELQVRQQIEYTHRQLEILTGEPVSGLARIEAGHFALLPPDPADLSRWISLAEADSPELRAARARVEEIREEIRKVRGAHYPTLDAIAMYSRSGSENVTSPDTRYRNWALGLQLNVPIYQGGMISSQERQAVAQLARAEELLAATRQDLSLRIYQEYRGITEGILRVQALEQAVRSGEELVRSTQRAFAAGSRTRLEILNAEQALQTSRRNLAEARYRYLLARFRLALLAGQDQRAIIETINGWFRPA